METVLSYDLKSSEMRCSFKIKECCGCTKDSWQKFVVRANSSGACVVIAVSLMK